MEFLVKERCELNEVVGIEDEVWMRVNRKYMMGCEFLRAPRDWTFSPEFGCNVVGLFSKVKRFYLKSLILNLVANWARSFVGNVTYCSGLNVSTRIPLDGNPCGSVRVSLGN